LQNFTRRAFAAVLATALCSLAYHLTLHHLAYRLDVASLGWCVLFLLGSPVLRRHTDARLRAAMWCIVTAFAFVDFRGIDSPDQLIVPSWVVCIFSVTLLMGHAVFQAGMFDASCILAGATAALMMVLDRSLKCDGILRRVPWHGLWHVFAGVLTHRALNLHAGLEARQHKRGL